MRSTDDKTLQAAVDRELEILMSLGYVRDCGRNEKGEIVYELTDAGKEYADRKWEEMQK